MAHLSGGKTKNLLLTATLGACCIALTACGPNTRERDLSERLAAAQASARASAASRMAKAQQDDPAPDPGSGTQGEADAAAETGANNGADAGQPDSDQPDYGSPTDPTSSDEDYGNDLSAGMDAAPNDFPAPPDPPMVGDISPDDMPTSE